jgi:hypothetical protein
MAVLTDTDYGEIRRSVYTAGQGKEELKALASVPNQMLLKAAFQVLEDFWSNNAATVKADMETALGFSISGALAKKIGLAWLIWKVSKGG